MLAGLVNAVSDTLNAFDKDQKVKRQRASPGARGKENVSPDAAMTTAQTGMVTEIIQASIGAVGGIIERHLQDHDRRISVIEAELMTIPAKTESKVAELLEWKHKLQAQAQSHE
jgi:hypothetical protein